MKREARCAAKQQSRHCLRNGKWVRFLNMPLCTAREGQKARELHPTSPETGLHNFVCSSRGGRLPNMRVGTARPFLRLLCGPWPVLALCVAYACSADEADRLELDEVLVTGSRVESAWELPRSATVITAADIERGTSTNLVDLLAHEANVNLRSVFGNDKFASLDIRGMGDTSLSNVLVLIDGVKINPDDLSGADFSSIPLDQIERIEVVRGANAVRYGSGAVGGVINIRTKRADGASHGFAKLNAGSFDSYGSAVAASTGSQGLSLDVRSSLSNSLGFRDNGQLFKKDGALELRYRGLEWLDAFARAELHQDRYGQPGPVSREDFKRSSRARRSTNAADDRGETLDRRYHAGAKMDFGAAGRFDGLISFRSRTNPFVIGYQPALSVHEQESTIESVRRQYAANHTLPFALFGYSHDLVIGYERESSDYERRENGRGYLDRSQSLLGSVQDQAGFISSHWSLPYHFAFEAGYRRDAFSVARRTEKLRRVCDTRLEDTVVLIESPIGSGNFIEVTLPNQPVSFNCRGQLSAETDQNRTWHNNAWEASVSVAPTHWSTAYLSYRRSFRNPNVDELTLATTDLRPQSGEHWDLGLRLRSARGYEAALSLFDMRVDDEIFFGFDVASGREVNRNLEDRTARRGVELELKGHLLKAVHGWANISYIDARLGPNRTFVPLVPREKVAAGFDWDIIPALTLSASCTSIGNRFDGNDFDNISYHKLGAYHVVEAKLRWHAPSYAVSFGINNMLDAVYATAGYSNTVYPMPSRSLMLELSVEI